MKHLFKTGLIVFLIIIQFAVAKGQIYLDPKAAVEDRVNDLLPKMTSAEKLNYIGGFNSFYIMPISRLKIPEIKMSDGPVGARNDGNTTAYPAGILTAATWDTTLVGRLGHALGKDCRSRGTHILLAPGLNIYRAPMAGRNFEYFGEDPYLSARMAVGYIKGLQSEQVVGTAKHFAANNQEWDRNNISSDVDERTFQEIYLPAFKAAVMEAKVGCVMSSYNLINGEWASHNHHLLTDILKDEWNFSGFVMSDWGAVHNGKSAALAGLDIEMPSGANMNSANLSPLIATGAVTQALIDDKVRRILRVLFRFGFFDTKQLDSSIPRDYAPNAQVALDLARGGIVLLKNQKSILPLDKNAIKSIAVIGQNANSAVAGGGSSYTSSFHSVSILNGIKAIAGSGVTVTYDPGFGDDAGSYANSIFYTSSTLATQGLNASYYSNKTLTGTAVKTQVDHNINFDWGANAPAVTGIPADNFSVRWTGFIKVPVTGDYTFYDRSDDGSRLWINSIQIINQWADQGAATKQATVHLTKDVIYPVKLEYYESAGLAEMKMGYKLLGFNDSPAILAAKNAEVAVVCIGFDGNTEGEGFDRPFQLPNYQDSLVNAISRVNPNTIVILNAGGNVATASWIGNAKALLHAWYTGQEGGTAVAEILFGMTNPSGKLPASFEKKWEDNPVFNSYYDPDGNKRVTYSEGLLVGYRYYDTKNVEPLFPFGFGLSYTNFDYSNLRITPENTDEPNSVRVSFDISNSGDRAGAEAAQLYISQPGAKVARPNKELKGFSKVFLTPGETKTITLKLDSASFSYFKEKKNAFGYDSGVFEIQVGASSRDIRLKGSLALTIKDITAPQIVILSPANKSVEAKITNTFSMTFTEPVYFNSDKVIRIKDYLTDKLIENVNAATLKGMGTNTLTFTNNIALKTGVRYYIDMDMETFLDYSDNAFAGILNKEVWNFTVSVTEAQNLKDQEAALNFYPNPATGLIILQNLPYSEIPTPVELLDLTGRKVDSFIVPENQTTIEYNCARLKSGIYMIRVSTPSGFLLKKLVKN
ncbi:MAG: glycoside hydrolase family 3 C-terminal domain-containing protein [Bacteroidia bacterium]